MGVVGQGGVRREVAEKDRRRTKGYEVVVDRGRGETGVGQRYRRGKCGGYSRKGSRLVYKNRFGKGKGV